MIIHMEAGPFDRCQAASNDDKAGLPTTLGFRPDGSAAYVAGSGLGTMPSLDWKVQGPGRYGGFDTAYYQRTDRTVDGTVPVFEFLNEGP
jgi:hypothetical protein